MSIVNYGGPPLDEFERVFRAAVGFARAVREKRGTGTALGWKYYDGAVGELRQAVHALGPLSGTASAGPDNALYEHDREAWSLLHAAADWASWDKRAQEAAETDDAREQTLESSASFFYTFAHRCEAFAENRVF